MLLREETSAAAAAAAHSALTVYFSSFSCALTVDFLCLFFYVYFGRFEKPKPKKLNRRFRWIVTVFLHKTLALPCSAEFVLAACTVCVVWFLVRFETAVSSPHFLISCADWLIGLTAVSVQRARQSNPFDLQLSVSAALREDSIISSDFAFGFCFFYPYDQFFFFFLSHSETYFCFDSETCTVLVYWMAFIAAPFVKLY